MTNQPLKLWTKLDWLLLVFILIALGVSASLYTDLPDLVPVHWNIQGEVDRYGSKLIGLFLVPCFSLVTLMLLSWLPSIDPFSQNYQRFAKAFQVFKIIITLFFLYIYAIMLYASYFEASFSANTFFVPAFSVLFIIMGFYLPRLKRNFFIGIKTPWTLSSDASWEKSHLWAGRVFVAAGVLNLVGLLISPELSFWLLIGILTLGVTGIMIYSYWVYKQDKNRRELS